MAKSDTPIACKYEYNVSLLAVSNFHVPLKCDRETVVELGGGNVNVASTEVLDITVAGFPYAVAKLSFSLTFIFLVALAP